MDLRTSIEAIAFGIEIVGVLVIVLAVVISGAAFVLRLGRREPLEQGMRLLRRSIGRGVLLGLELLVAGDIIRTVTIEPSLENVAVLALIVLVRTFLSFSLEIELSGRLPWSRGDRGAVDGPAAS